MDNSAFLVELHRAVIDGARFVLMVCVGMFLAYGQFAVLTLVAAALRRRVAPARPAAPARTGDLYPARTSDRVLSQ